MTEEQTVKTEETTGKRRKTIVGKVTSDKMDKTIVVVAVELYKHPVVKKYIKRYSKYYAHDADNIAQTGDRVEIEETNKPLSKLKRWNFVRKLTH